MQIEKDQSSSWIRRQFPALLGILMLLAALSAWLAWQSDPGQDDDLTRPAEQRDVPVIIYLVDTLRADRLGIYGYSQPTSPVLDALAAESVVFEQAYAPAPWTLPSVASLITSTFVCEHGLTRGKKKLNPAVKTLAERLESVGFKTAGYYNNLLAGSLADLHRGYQEFVFKSWNEDERAADVDKFLNDIAEEPFYLYLHTLEPHTTWSVPSRLIRQFGHVSVDDREAYEKTYLRYRELRYADYKIGKPVGTTDNSELQDQTRAELEELLDSINVLYDASVLEADTNLGDVIRVLKQRGVWDRAIFIFLSDHGEELGEHDGWFHDQNVYDELVRVPLLIHFPGDEFSGQRIDTVVSLVDIMPTIFAYLGRRELCAGCRGTSLMDMLKEGNQKPDTGPVPALRINEQSYYKPWKETRGDVNVVVRQDRWKGIWNAEPETFELYRLDQDPGELAEQSSSYPQVAQQLRERATDWFDQCKGRIQAPEERDGDELDPETMEKLHALGYFN